MVNEKTMISISLEFNEAIKMIKKEEGFKNADSVIEMLLMQQRPDLVERARKIVRLRRGE